MSLRIAFDSRRVRVPLVLADLREEGAEASGLHPYDTLSVLVLVFLADGEVRREMFPLRLAPSSGPYDGRDFELRSLPASPSPGSQAGQGQLPASHELGIPDRYFALDASHPRAAAIPHSLALQVVGSSALNPGRTFSGGVEVLLGRPAARPSWPVFLGLLERFFPSLLPSSFVEKPSFRLLSDAGEDLFLVKLPLKLPEEGGRQGLLPRTFHPDWPLKGWREAWMELSPTVTEDPLHLRVEAGFFEDREGAAGHGFSPLNLKGWAERGLDLPALAGAAGRTPDGAWVFIARRAEAAQGVSKAEPGFKAEPAAPAPSASPWREAFSCSIRAPSLGSFLRHDFRNPDSIALHPAAAALFRGLKKEAALSALGGLARLAARGQGGGPKRNGGGGFRRDAEALKTLFARHGAVLNGLRKNFDRFLEPALVLHYERGVRPEIPRRAGRRKEKILLPDLFLRPAPLPSGAAEPGLQPFGETVLGLQGEKPVQGL